LVKVIVQAQLFARPSIAPEGALSTSANYKDQIIKGKLSVETVTPLCKDILVNWDTTYSRDHFETCKDFDGPVDKECDCQIPATKFNQVPLNRNLVDTFCVMFPYLTVDMVWLIVKSKPGIGFHSWHRDFYLDKKIVKTIVVNLDAMKRSDVPGAAFGELRKSPTEVTDKTMKGEGKSVLNNPTKETDETKKVERDETMIEDESTELRSPQENSDDADDKFLDPHKEVVDSSVDGWEPHSCGVQTFSPSLTPVYQNLHSMPQILPLSLPPIVKGKLPLDKWVCDKCDAEQTVNKMRYGACKSWRGGKKGALKKSESTKKDKQHPVNHGRKPKQTQPAATVAVDCSNLLISGEDAFSPLTAGPNVNDESIEESTID
jgi:hypothetical protein